MASQDDDDVPLGEAFRPNALGELDELLGELTTLLKNPDVVGALTERGVNASLALLAMQGLGAYLTGDKHQAAEDLKTVGEEIEGRLKFGDDPPVA
ncbi:MAG: hypothetical protein U0271_48100 [Polyangiaceae bacterium]